MVLVDKTLTEEGKYTSSVSGNDTVVVGVVDISRAEYYDPPPITIRLPASELARTACVVLMDLLQGKGPPSRRLMLTTELVIRKSCRKL